MCSRNLAAEKGDTESEMSQLIFDLIILCEALLPIIAFVGNLLVIT